MELKDLNTMLVANELKSLYAITNSIIKNKNSSILFFGFCNYVILLNIEIYDYINKVYGEGLTYPLKSRLKESRARIKEYNIDSEKVLRKIEDLNCNSFEHYSKDLPVITKVLFGKLITNLGIYKYNDIIVSNTFLIDKDFKPIIYKNGVINREKIRETGEVLGKNLSFLYSIFFKDVQYTTETNIDESFTSEDYNVTKKNKLLKPNIDINVSLFFLDILSIINYCIVIIDKFEICDGLKYRIFYLAYYRTYHNLKIVVDNSSNDYLSIKKIIKKYEFLDNRDFRNSMYHYYLLDKLEENEIVNDQMYLGIIYKHFGINDIDYKKQLKSYLKETSNSLSEYVLRNNQ